MLVFVLITILTYPTIVSFFTPRALTTQFITKLANTCTFFPSKFIKITQKTVIIISIIHLNLPYFYQTRFSMVMKSPVQIHIPLYLLVPMIALLSIPLCTYLTFRICCPSDFYNFHCLSIFPSLTIFLNSSCLSAF